MASQTKRCTRCILPDSFPNIAFDDAGVCNECHKYERRWNNLDLVKSEKYITDVFETAKSKKNKYDCIMGFSGGKDSSYAIYLCTQKYKMKPLCVTFDNGFISKDASANIKKLTTKLNVDHIFVKPDWELLKRLYRHFLLTTGEFCTTCNIGITSSLYDTANKYGIPLIISGFSPRTDAYTVNSMYHISAEYFYNVTKGHFAKNEIKDFLHSTTTIRALNHLTGRIRYITLPLYIEWDEDKMIKVLEKELAWKVNAAITTEHTDCIASGLKEYLRIKEFGFSEKTIKFSVSIRNGSMNREEALAKVKAFEASKMADESGLMHKVLKMLDISEQELAEATNKRQKAYIPGFAKLLEKDTLMKKLYYKY